MAKAIILDDSAFEAPPKPPRASPKIAGATSAKIDTTPAPKPPRAKVQHVPLQIRIPSADAKAIKIAAVQADQTISDFILACIHAKMKA